MKIKNPKGCSIPFENDGRYTKEMYRGNAPACKGDQYIVDGKVETADQWQCRFGGGDVLNGVVMFGTFYLNERVSICIIYDVVEIVDIRYSNNSDVFIWRSDNRPINKELNPNGHILEPDRIEAYLQAEVEDCIFWKLFQRRVFEIIRTCEEVK